MARTASATAAWPADSVEAAAVARLRYVRDSAPGIARVRRGPRVPVSRGVPYRFVGNVLPDGGGTTGGYSPGDFRACYSDTECRGFATAGSGMRATTNARGRWVSLRAARTTVAAHRVSKSECGWSSVRLPHCGEVGQRLPRRSLRQGHWLTTVLVGQSRQTSSGSQLAAAVPFGSRAQQLQLTTL